MKSIFKHIVKISLLFLLMMTSYVGFQNIITLVYEQDDLKTLGPFRMIFTYTSYMLANMVVSQIRSVSVKWIFTFAMLGYALNYSTEIYASSFQLIPRYAIVAMGSIIGGLAESAAWIGLGRHIHLLCEEYGEVDKKGQHYGMFYLIMYWCNITGALMVMFGLGSLPPNLYFIIITACTFLAFFLSAVFVKDIHAPHLMEESLAQNLCNMLGFYPNMKPLLGLIFIHGINIGVTTSTLFHLMPQTSSHSQDNFRWGTILLVGGFAAMIGSYFGSRLCDIISMLRVCLLGLSLYVVSCLTAFLAYFFSSYYLAMVVMVIWGFQFCYIFSALMVCCSKLYNGAAEAFAVVSQFHCLSFLLYQIIAIGTENSIQICYIMPVLIVFAIPTYFLLLGLQVHEQTQTNTMIFEE